MHRTSRTDELSRRWRWRQRSTPKHSPYQWMVDRARAGEPVSISTDRTDINALIDFLLTVDGRGLTIQSDHTEGLLWLVRSEDA